jgi:hypothetical protein
MATSSLGYIDDIIRDQIAAAGNDASKLQKIATSFGLSADDLASFKGVSTGDIQQLFRDAGIPLGTLLTGDVQRTFGTDTGIRQVEKGDDIVTEQVVGVQGDKLIVQQYDAYGNPTSRRLTKPNPSELQGWLQALGTVGMAMGAGDVLSSLGGSAGAGSGSLASNLTVGEAASAITNPTQIVTKPITNTLTDYVVSAINSNALAGVEMLPGVAEQVALTAAEKAAIKTGVGMLVNGTASELLGGDFKEGATGTLAGTILNNVPIPGSGDLLGTNKDVPFTSLVGNLATKGLDVTGISDLSDKVSEKLSNGIAKGTTAGLTTLIAGGNSNDIYRNTGLGAIMGTFGDTKIPGTKLTGDDALELIQDSFAEGTDATNLINDAAGKVVVKADVDPLDQFDPTGFFTGSGFGDGKKANVTGGSGADTLKAGAVTVAGGKGNDSINDTISDYIESGSGNDSIKAGTVEVTGASDPCENPNQIRDPITGGCYDPIDYVVLGGSGNDTIDAGKVTVTAADCNKIGMDYDPIENKCVERVDISGLSTFKPKTPTPPPATSTKVVDTFCKYPKIRDNVNGGCVCPPGYIEQGEDCKESAKVTVTAADCYAKGMGYNPQTNSCFDLEYTTLNLTGGAGNDTCPPGTTKQADGQCKPSLEVTAKKCNEDQYKGADGNCYCLDPDQAPNALGLCQDTTTVIIDTMCPVIGQERNTAGDCVCPPGTTEQNGECKPSVKVEACPALGQTRDAAGNCVCPPGQVAVNDTVSGGQICSTPETTITGGGGNDTITGDKCPTGYTHNAKTGECEFNLVGLPSLFTNLTLGGDGPASYTPNLTQPFTAARTYKAPPETYDYAGADTVGYEDPYFQRFGPITYTPPTGYLGAGVLPSPAGGTDTDTVDGAGVDTSGGGLAYGGLLSLARGGRTLPPRYLGGITDGMADRVPAHIDGKRPAALSDGEFVIPADVVSHLGNGNSSAGAKMLYEMMDRVRKARTGTKKQGREIDAERFMPR